MADFELNRRQFLVTTSVMASGFLLGIHAGADDTVDANNGGVELNAWVEIGTDNRITVRVPTPEIGNGTATQVAMNIAEELACDWSTIRVEFASVNRDYREGGIYNTGFLAFFGGHGTREHRLAVCLQVGASARERLKTAAARRWQVAPEEVIASDSQLSHPASNRQCVYGDVAIDAAGIQLHREPDPKPRQQWTMLGKQSPAKLNIPDITRGQATFGIDVKIPGMVHAALKQSPVHGGKLVRCEKKAVLAMPGVRAVVILDAADSKHSPVKSQANFGLQTSALQSGVAVVADHYWQAKMALDALPIEWDNGEGRQWRDEGMIYEAGRQQHDSEDSVPLLTVGDISAVKAGKRLEATYSTPYCENAMMEPLNGTARVTPEGVDVWCPTQDMLQAFWVTIDETGMAPERVHIHQTYVGGRFGRGTQADDVRVAVAIARQYPGVPVKTIWSREECFQQARLRTPVLTRFNAVLGEDGYPQAIDSRLTYVGTSPVFQLPLGYSDSPYFHSGGIANVKLASNHMPISVLNGAYRGPCYNSHAFIVETFIDECAISAGIDPLEYRLTLLSNWKKSWSDCLRIAAKKSGWGRSLPKGEGLGIAIAAWPAGNKRDYGSVVCTAAHVAVSPAGQLHVKRLDITFDCGRVANADAVRAQIEGGTLFGMNMTLNEQVTIKDGAIVETNFHQYPMLRMGDQLPDIHIHFDALSGDDRFDIVGEVPVGPVGPAIGNAIFQATGKRLRSTPFLNHDLSWDSKG